VAALRAVGTLEANADETIVSLARRCHDALQPTRGAVMGLASFSAWDNRMQWLGIGNVEGVVLHAHDAARATARPGLERLLARGGIVGHRLPRLLVSTVPLTCDDVVVLATDGIRTDFTDCLAAGEPSQGLAERILAQYGKESDDALVLVARYLGPAP
jgi:phosphoserine phosphatase RsbX